MFVYNHQNSDTIKYIINRQFGICEVRRYTILIFIGLESIYFRIDKKNVT